MTTRQKIGRQIKILRQKAGLTQELLADKTGIDYKCHQKIEGKNTPNLTIDTLDRIAKALKVPLIDIFQFK